MLEIQLIQPPRSEGYEDNSRSACYLPLGLVSIATYLKHQFPDSNIEVLDGEMLSRDEIVGRLKPNSFVGIDTKTPNYESALEIAKKAKRLESIVVFGGVYASAVPDRILKYSGENVDHVVVGYGEIAFEQIINGSPDRKILNGSPNFNKFPVPDRTKFLDLEPYIENFQEQHSTWDYRATNIFTQVGCKYRCLFCDRTKPSKGVYSRNPESIWSEIHSLTEKEGIDYVVDFSDTITQNPDFLRRLAETKPPDLNPVFHIFSTADGINPTTIDLMRRINVHHVFVGVESGDEELAKTIYKGKGFSPAVSLEAITQLVDAQIGLTPSFVLGLPGENEESLERTYNHASRIKRISGFEEIFCSALIPFPGSIAFGRLEKIMEIEGTPFNTDVFDPEELKRKWISKFCDVDYGKIMAVADQILALGKYTITIKRSD
jgi:anaerobic magnesium-protoporphyrin IX monomethyl ester cyclase